MNLRRVAFAVGGVVGALLYGSLGLTAAANADVDDGIITPGSLPSYSFVTLWDDQFPPGLLLPAGAVVSGDPVPGSLFFGQANLAGLLNLSSLSFPYDVLDEHDDVAGSFDILSNQFMTAPLAFLFNTPFWGSGSQVVTDATGEAAAFDGATAESVYFGWNNFAYGAVWFANSYISGPDGSLDVVTVFNHPFTLWNTFPDFTPGWAFLEVPPEISDFVPAAGMSVDPADVAGDWTDLGVGG